MPSVRAIACGVVVMLVAAAGHAQPVITGPPEAAWRLTEAVREDLRPLEIGTQLLRQPQIDGTIDPAEWEGAVRYEVEGDPGTAVSPMGMMTMGMGTMEPFGAVYFGLYNGYLQVGTDWTIGDNPAMERGTNAWRFGTSMGPGAENSGQGTWFDVFVEEMDAGGPDAVWARSAPTEADLEAAEWKPAEFYEISAAAGFSPDDPSNPDVGHWQFELSLGGMSNNPVPAGGGITPAQQEPGPGPLPYCWHWEWRQIDPRPSDGYWLPVYDGSLHNSPEPGTILLVGSGLLGVWMRRRRRK